MHKCRGLLPCVLLVPLWAQDPTPGRVPDPLAAAPSSQARPPVGEIGKSNSSRSSSQTQTPATSKDRILFALPNFFTLENAGQVRPLTTAEKFKVTTEESFDPYMYFWYGALAGIGQAENSPPSCKQGAEGYAKRYGTQFADGTVENYMTHALLPSLLHQDPRYLQMGKGGFWRRTGYAVSRMLVTRSDSGHNQFNYSEIVGSAAGASISMNYHPAEERNLGGVMSIWGAQIAYDTVSMIAKEFWPDIRRKLQRPKTAAAPDAGRALVK